MTVPMAPTTGATPPAVSLADADPGGLAASIQVAVGSVLLALGMSDTISTRWALAIQAVVSVLGQLWARRRAWAPMSVLRAVEQGRQVYAAEIDSLAPPEE